MQDAWTRRIRCCRTDMASTKPALFKVVIPARYGSTRLPAKAIADVAGRPMIQWVIAAAFRSSAEEVLVATDDVRVAALATYGDPAQTVAVMTSERHQSGTDRIAEVAATRGWEPQTIVVNVQGDEPQLPPALIDQVATLLAAQPQADLATLSTPITTREEFLDPNVVKVVTDDSGFALYFSRAPIPWDRDGAAVDTASMSFAGAQRHLGIYAYRVAALGALTSLPPGKLEVTERLEQLRAMQAGMRIAVAVALTVPGIGVDTEHDLARVRAALATR
jgi:3-deoxy-manno-octulosonate cytidylyltransferase (CMP-KDO synthetase)